METLLCSQGGTAERPVLGGTLSCRTRPQTFCPGDAEAEGLVAALLCECLRSLRGSSLSRPGGKSLWQGHKSPEALGPAGLC